MLRLRCAHWVLIGWMLLLAGSTGCQQSGRPDAATAASSNEIADRDEAEVHLLPAMKSAPAENESYFQRALGAQTKPTDLGQGPGMGGDKYAHLVENRFIAVADQPLSTFSLDVDTASYSKTRMYLMQRGALPPVDAVRIEELVNYFDYAYSQPSGDHPFAIHVEVAQCPWESAHLLARVGIKGRDIEQERPPCNLVFLLDVSGSMNAANKLGLVKQSMRMLTSQLSDQDRVAIVVYAGAAGLVLPATYGDQRGDILAAIDRLEAGGSTNGGAGIQLAYKVAQENHIADGINRVILCTDGDFNVGTTSTGDLVRMAEAEAKGEAGVFLTVLAFGMGNHNDAMLEEISNKANGTYAFIDNEAEARKVFIDQIDSTLVTIAKDVKVQIEFNPAEVSAYRLVGYENRLLAAQDFNDDQKDAGEVGAGHTITALYQIVPAGAADVPATPRVDELKYQAKKQLSEAASQGELMMVKLRYKQPNEDISQLISQIVPTGHQTFGAASLDYRFAASVAGFGMVLRKSPECGDLNLEAVLEMATAAVGDDPRGYRREFVEMVQKARQL